MKACRRGSPADAGLQLRLGGLFAFQVHVHDVVVEASASVSISSARASFQRRRSGLQGCPPDVVLTDLGLT